jgi:hypothetical protein
MICSWFAFALAFLYNASEVTNNDQGKTTILHDEKQ